MKWRQKLAVVLLVAGGLLAAVDAARVAGIAMRNADAEDRAMPAPVFAARRN